MTSEIGLWRIDGGRALPVRASSLDREQTLEDVLAADPSMLGLGPLLIVGRQVVTPHGTRVDLLALNGDAHVYVIELKRDRSPRDFVAQGLDYAAWAQDLVVDDLELIWQRHGNTTTLAEGFRAAFAADPPDDLNTEHRVVLVATSLDPSSERIVSYLSNYGVPLNVVFFRHFADDERSYIARTWLVEPAVAEGRAQRTRVAEPWNGVDMYVSFGEDEARTWEDARRYGFVSGGGAAWYSRTLESLKPGMRVWVNIPKRGYVGVGRVVEERVPIREFTVEVDGDRLNILDAPLGAANMGRDVDDDERCEYLVRVEWEKTVAISDAVWEKGFFANQNTACQLRRPEQIRRMVELFGLDEGSEIGPDRTTLGLDGTDQ